MRIGGEVALALPAADCETSWLDMSADERLLYSLHECVNGHAISLDDTSRFQACVHLYEQNVVSGATLAGSSEYTLDAPAQIASFPAACAAFLRTHDKIVTPARVVNGVTVALATTHYKASGAMTKYRRLIDDLAAVRAAEREMRVVVFTRECAATRIPRLVPHHDPSTARDHDPITARLPHHDPRTARAAPRPYCPWRDRLSFGTAMRGCSLTLLLLTALCP